MRCTFRRLSIQSIATLFATFIAGQAGAEAAPEKRATLADQTEVAVTIYNNDLALVRDQRQLALDKGTNVLAFREVSAKIRPETALLRSVSHPQGLTLIEQNFDYDLLTPQKLLEKFVGINVGIIRSHPTTGAEITETARVLSVNDGVVLQYPDRIEMQSPGRVVFNEVPPNLRDRPTLVLQLNSTTAEKQIVELSYLTTGLAWKADYVAVLSKNDDQLDLAGWVTLNNQSGATYTNAKLQLVAGDVNRVEEEMQAFDTMKMKRLIAPMAAAPEMREESLFEYHLYTLSRPTTIAENQSKQVSLLSASGVPVRKEFRLHGQDYYYQSKHGDIGEKLKVAVYVELKNDEKSHLGIPLPKGIVRVYKKDDAGNAQFIGEDRIDHTPKNEEVELKLGDAFDITADKKQTDFKKQSAVLKYDYVADITFVIKLKNAKSTPVTVSVMEPIPGDWEMIKETHKHEKAAAHSAQWKVDVPAEAEAKLEYTVRVRY